MTKPKSASTRTRRETPVKPLDQSSAPDPEAQRRIDFPQDYAPYAIKVRPAGEESDFSFVKADGDTTPWRLEAEVVDGKAAAHDRFLDLVSGHPEFEYRLVEF